MLNYIRMDLFKIFRSRAFIICTLCFMLLNYATIVIIKNRLENKAYAQSEEIIYDDENIGEIEDVDNMGEMEDDEQGVAVMTGVSVQTSAAVAHDGNLLYCVETLYNGGILFLFLTLIIIIVVCDDFATGFIKNTITIPKYRWYVNISKLVGAFLVFLFENIVGILMFAFAIGFTDFSENATIGGMKDIVKMIRYLSVQAVFALSIMAIIIWIADVTNSKVVSIIISVLVVFGVFEGLFLAIAAGPLKVDSDSVLKLMKWMPMNASYSVMVSDSAGMMLKSAGSGLIWFIVFMILSNIVISKKDI